MKKFLFDKYVIFDTNLIEVFQYIVRQFELYTSVTKKHLLYFLNFLIICLVFFIIQNTIIFNYKSEAHLAIFACSGFVSFIFLKKVFSNYKRGKNKKDDINEAMFQRVNLFPVRLVLWLGFLAFVLISSFDIYVYFSFPAAAKSNSFIPAFRFSLFLLINSVIDVIFEYICCTYSLPPGEKRKHEEKKKIEKEMNNMIPNS